MKKKNNSLQLIKNINFLSGFILLPLLVLMLIISLFGLYTLTTAGLSIKTQTEAWEQDNLKTLANQILKNIEKKMNIDNETCVIAVSNPAQFASQPLSWWLKNSCNGHFKQITYYYVIENLGEDPCAINKDLIANYYRITLLSLIPNKSHIILQSTVAKGRRSNLACLPENSHRVALGKQMQRELIRRVN